MVLCIDIGTHIGGKVHSFDGMGENDGGRHDGEIPTDSTSGSFDFGNNGWNGVQGLSSSVGRGGNSVQGASTGRGHQWDTNSQFGMESEGNTQQGSWGGSGIGIGAGGESDAIGNAGNVDFPRQFVGQQSSTSGGEADISQSDGPYRSDGTSFESNFYNN